MAVKYEKGVATVPVFFPDGNVCCKYCRFCKCDERYRRFSCTLTAPEAWVLDIGARQEFCPLKFVGEDKQDKLSLGEKIKAARKGAGMTQQQLSEKVGLAMNSISRYESGERFPDIYVLQKIATALNVPAEYFI
jgi:DNA-binding XRE family transcriptional regulator